MASSTISTRLDTQDLDLLESLTRLSGMDRSSLVRSLLRKGLEGMRVELAAKEYRDGKVSMSRAAEIAGLGVWDFLAILKPLGLELNLDEEELERDLRALSLPG